MPVGRPSKLEDRTRATILTALSYGATLDMAAEDAGVHPSTLKKWMQHNDELRDAVSQAKASARVEKLRLLHLAATRGNVAAITWLLERLEPDLFGKPHGGNGNGGADVNVTVNVAVLPDDQLEALAAGRPLSAIAAIAGPGGTGAAPALEGEAAPGD